jgi:hypothetical protein
MKRIAPWAAGAYLIGLIGMVARLVLGFAASARMRRQGETVKTTAWTGGLSRMGAAIGVRVQPALQWSRDVAAPVIIGFVKPVILLPVSLASRLTPAQVEAVLAHELAHLKRRDTWSLAVQRVSETVLFFHPAVWWMSRRMEAAREEACDDLVLAAGCDPADYAEALVICSECRLEQGDLAAKLTSRLAAGGNNSKQMHRRILRLLGGGDDGTVRLGHTGWVLGFVLAGGMAMVLAAGSANDVASVAALESGTNRSGNAPAELKRGYDPYFAQENFFPNMTLTNAGLSQMSKSSNLSSTVPVENNAWGDAIDGVQVRLHSPRQMWSKDEFSIYFKTDLRSATEHVFPHYGPMNAEFFLELDGQWYEANIPGTFASVGPSPAMHREDLHTWITARLWRSMSTGAPMPDFASGRHTFRIGFPLSDKPDASGQRPRAVSNPVEVEVIPKDDNVSITGNVTGIRGKPADVYRVTASPRKWNTSWGEMPVTMTGTDGTFAFRGLPDGSCDVSVTPVPLTGLPNMRIEGIVVKSGSPVHIALSLEEKYAFSGRFTDAEGRPQTNRSVLAIWKDPAGQATYSSHSKTDVGGRYHFQSPFEVAESIRINDGETRNINEHRNVHAGRVDVDFQLIPFGTIKKAEAGGQSALKLIPPILQSLKQEVVALSKEYPQLAGAEAVPVKPDGWLFARDCRDMGKPGYKDTGSFPVAIGLKVMSKEDFRAQVGKVELPHPSYEWDYLGLVGWTTLHVGERGEIPPGLVGGLQEALRNAVVRIGPLNRQALAASLPQAIQDERDRLLAKADARIREGVQQLAETYPLLTKGQSWEHLKVASDPGRIGIYFRRQQGGKGATDSGTFPPAEAFGILVIIKPPPDEIEQLVFMPVCPRLGLVGQVNTTAADPALAAALKKLVSDALAPLGELEARVTTRPAARIANAETKGEAFANPDARQRFLAVERFARLPLPQQAERMPEFYKGLPPRSLGMFVEGILSSSPHDILNRYQKGDAYDGNTGRWAQQLADAASRMSAEQVADNLKDRLWLDVASRARALWILKQHPIITSNLVVADLESRDTNAIQRAATVILALELKNFTSQLLEMWMANDELSESVWTALLFSRDPAMVKPLLERVNKDPKFLIRCAGLFQGPLHNQPAEPVLLKLLDSPDPEIRYSAAYALEECLDSRLAQPAVRLAGDTDSKSRFVAAHMVAKLPEASFKEARSGLLPLLSDKDEQVRYYALLSFGRRKDLAAGPVILEALRLEKLPEQYKIWVMQSMSALSGGTWNYYMHEWGPARPDNQKAIERFESWLKSQPSQDSARPAGTERPGTTGASLPRPVDAANLPGNSAWTQNATGLTNNASVDASLVSVHVDAIKVIPGDSGNSKPSVEILFSATNIGPYMLHMPENGDYHQVQVDGRWYERVDPVAAQPGTNQQAVVGRGTRLLEFNPGSVQTNRGIRLDGNWREIPTGKEQEYVQRQYGGFATMGDDYGAGLTLNPGVHRMQIAVVCRPARAGLYRMIRSVSQTFPVEVPGKCITIKGVVERPGEFSIGDADGLNRAVLLAGGFKENAYLRKIEVVRDGKTNEVNFWKIRNGESPDMQLESGDVINVKPIAPMWP